MPIPLLQGRHSFVTTNWNAIHNNELSLIIECYWGPTFYYLLRKGHGEAEAEDLTQGFFTDCFKTNRFSKADPTRGRFRAFLLSSLDNFLANTHRKATALKRHPQGGIVSIEGMADTESPHYEPSHQETPAAAFNRVWATELITRVLNTLEAECLAKGKQEYFEVFRRCIIEPALDGTVPPPRSEFAAKYGIREKEVSNRLITTRRAYQRLLRVEIQKYETSDDEVDAEMRDLIGFLGSK